MQEIWKDIEGYNGKYRISTFGRVMAINGKYNGEHIFSPALDFVGYPITSLRINGRKTYFRLHRLVAEAFIPNPDNKKMVNHIDGNKANNNVQNLEWSTPLENITHAIKAGLINANGEKSSNSKLKTKDVLRIREMASNGITHDKIQMQFPVGRRHITDIVNRVNWKHI
jgi:hypothetical protein